MNNDQNKGNNKNEKKGSFKNNRSQGGDFEEKVIEIRRVSKKTQGGNKIGFTALVVIGDRKGKVASGYGKAESVVDAINKALSKAKEDVVDVVLANHTIPHDIEEKYGASKIILRPAPEGTGVIAGGSVRTVVELAGVKDISSKCLGTKNKISNVRCTINALKKLRERK